MALTYNVLRNRDFRRLLATRLAGIFGLQAQAVIVGWQVYTLTHDALMLGLIGLTEAVPAVLFALFAGHIVDKSRPHRIFMRCLAAHTLISLVLLLVAGGYVVSTPKGMLAVLFGGIFSPASRAASSCLPRSACWRGWCRVTICRRPVPGSRAGSRWRRLRAPPWPG